MKLFTLYGDLELATKNFNSGVEAARSQMQGLKGQMDGLQEDATKTGGVLEGAFGYALGDILSGLTEGIVEAAFGVASGGVEIASSLEEIQHVVDTVYGSNAEQFNKWAEGAKESFGMGELAAKSYAASIADILSPETRGFNADEIYEMSTALTALIGDISSFKNIGFDEVFSMIMSGLRGETESIERLGIDMRLTSLAAFAGLEKESDFSKLSDYEQTMYRYQYIMSATARMQGNFAETEGSYANQQRLFQENIIELQATIGEGLLPIMTDLVTWFNNFFDGSEDASAGLDAIKDSAADSLVSIETTTANALALVNALKDLEATGEDASSSETWNALLGELRVVLPEIGSLIDNETGKITGGTAALEAYVAQWRTTSMQLAQQKVVQDMYDEYAVLQAELAKLQTEQNIADTLRAGAAQSMDEMGEQLLATMLYGMEEMGASAADIKAMQQFGAEGAENLLARLAGGGNTAMVMGALLKGGDLRANKSFEKYFEAGGGTDAMLSNMIALYQGYQKTFEQYNIDNADEIAERQALLAGQEQEITVLQQILAQLAANGSTVVNVTLDSDPVAAKVEQRISRNARNKSFTVAVMK